MVNIKENETEISERLSQTAILIQDTFLSLIINIIIIKSMFIYLLILFIVYTFETYNAIAVQRYHTSSLSFHIIDFSSCYIVN